MTDTSKTFLGKFRLFEGRNQLPVSYVGSLIQAVHFGGLSS